MPGDKIGEWTSTQLIKFVQDIWRRDPPPLPTTGSMDELTVSRKLTVADEAQFLFSQLGVGAAGSASALPATPELYAKVLGPNGNALLIPLYRV